MSIDAIDKLLAFIFGVIFGVFIGWITLEPSMRDRYREFAIKEKVAYYTNDANGKVVFKFKSNCE